MPKAIKKSYYYLNLPFSSTKEDVERQEKVLIKIERAKALKKGKSRKDKIEKIVKHANNILLYVKQNGIPNIKETFNISYKTIIIELCVLIVISIVGFIGYFSLV